MPEARFAAAQDQQQWTSQRQQREIVPQRVRWMRTQEAVEVLQLQRLLEQWQDQSRICHIAGRGVPDKPFAVFPTALY